MGMFTPLPDRFDDVVGEGNVFTLLAAKVVTIPTQDYGNRDAVEMRVRYNGEEVLVSAFGSGLVAQVTRQDDGDLPVNVRVERVPSAKPGRQPVRLLIPEGQDAPTQAIDGDDEAPY